MAKDLYEVLGVSRDATEADIVARRASCILM